MTTGRINQVNGAGVETVHYRAFALRETDDREAAGPQQSWKG